MRARVNYFGCMCELRWVIFERVIGGTMILFMGWRLILGLSFFRVSSCNRRDPFDLPVFRMVMCLLN